MDDEGKSFAKVEIVGEDLIDCVNEAAEACPVSCIHVEQIE